MVFMDTLRLQRRLRETGMSDEKATLVTEKLASIVAEELATGASAAEVFEAMTERIDEIIPILQLPDAEPPA